MSRIHRPSITRYVDANGRRCTKSTPGARKISEKSKTYWGVYRDAEGIERWVALSTDKTAAQAMLADKVKAALNTEAGLRSRFDDHLAKPLKKHLADYRKVQEARKRSPVHIDNSIRWTEEALNGCRIVWWRDLSVSSVEMWLSGEIAADRGLATLNHVIESIKAFLNWLVADGRAPSNPLQGLGKYNADTDRRRVRRALTTDELSRLFDVTVKSSTIVSGFDGPTREILYRAAAYTGLRASELASLTEGSFDFAGGTVSISAKSTKNRKTADLPLHVDFAARLQAWLEARRRAAPTLTLKPATAKLWPGGWAEKRRGASMLRMDLEAAGIAHAGDDGERVDFHALRTTFVTQLARAGVSLVDAQKLARHSTPQLTAKSYTKLTLHDLAGSVSKLPNAEAKAAAKTGTDDKPVTPAADLVARLVARPPATDCHNSGQSAETADGKKKQAGDRKLQSPAMLSRSEPECPRQDLNLHECYLTRPSTKNANKTFQQNSHKNKAYSFCMTLTNPLTQST